MNIIHDFVAYNLEKNYSYFFIYGLTVLLNNLSAVKYPNLYYFMSLS